MPGIDPSIPLSYQPPKLMSLNDVFAEQRAQQQFGTQQQLAGAQLQNAQLQQTALGQENQQRAIEIQENQGVKDAITQAYQNGGDISDALPGIMQASPTRGAAIQKTLLENKKSISDLQNSALEHDIKSAGFIAQALGGVKDQDGYAGALAALHASHIDTSQMPLAYDPATVAQYVQRGTSINDQLQQTKEKRESSASAQALADKQRTDALQQLSSVTDQPSYDAWLAANPAMKASAGALYSPAAVASLQRQAVPVEKQPEFDIANQEATQMAKITPAGWQAQVDAAIRDPKLNQTTKALLNTSPTWKDKQKVLQEAAGQQATLDRETNPSVMQARINQSIATQRGMYAGQSALAEVPPHLVAPATAAYDKSGQSYANAISAQQEMGDLINLARGGNKVAYAYAPTTGVLTINSANGTKRVNMAEIEQYAGAGSAMDKITGWLGKQTSGASIPADVLNDMEAVHSKLGQVAQSKHANEVKVINQTYGAKFQPMQLQTGDRPAAGAPAIKPTHSLNGREFGLDPKTNKYVYTDAQGGAVQ